MATNCTDEKHNVLEPKRNMDQSIGYAINTDFFDMCQHVGQVFDKYLRKKVLHLHLNRCDDFFSRHFCDGPFPQHFCEGPFSQHFRDGSFSQHFGDGSFPQIFCPTTPQTRKVTCGGVPNHTGQSLLRAARSTALAGAQIYFSINLLARQQFLTGNVGTTRTTLLVSFLSDRHRPGRCCYQDYCAAVH